MPPIHFDPAQIARHLPRAGRVLVLGCAGESQLFADAIIAAGDDIGDLTFVGIFIPGVNRHTYLANSRCRLEAFFYTPEFGAAPAEQVRFLPLCYADILAYLRANPMDAAVMMVAPADADGLCSFGNTVDFLAALWREIPIRIAHINPAMPATTGHDAIPFDELTAYTELAAPLITSAEGAADEQSRAIAGHVASFIGDGATLQTGVGKVPGAILRTLVDRRDLRIHSGLVVDAVLDLIQAGALAEGTAITAGCAIGTRRLYDALPGVPFRFEPVPRTHGALVIAAIPDFISINSTLEVDLLGQAYSEVGPKGLASGPGGASDYARAARLSRGGLRIIALAGAAARGTISRIVAPNAGTGPVSLSRMDVDIVVTEHGAADLRFAGHQARAEALIAIAPPDHRAALDAAWRDFAQRL